MKSNHTTADIGMTAAGFCGLIAVTVYTAVRWETLPEEIPSHYNMAGEIDGTGGKGLLIFLLVTAWVLWAVLEIISLVLRQMCNGETEASWRDPERYYRILKTMVEVLKLITALDFTYMVFCSITLRPLGWYFTPLFLILIFGNIIVSIVRLLRNR